MGKKVEISAAKQPESPRIETKTTSNNEISELKKLVEVLQGRISSLENKVETLENKVVVLESTLELSQNTSDKLSAEVDNMHQYSRRNCLIALGILIKHGESTADLKRSIEKNVLKDVVVSKEFFDSEFDKVPRIGAADGDKQNVIVRFRSHQFPIELYYAQKKIKNKKIRLKPSLTKKKTALLRNITEKIETNENYCDTVKFCYSGFNGNIKVRLHELHKCKYVDTIANVNKIETLVEEITNNKN